MSTAPRVHHAASYDSSSLSAAVAVAVLEHTKGLLHLRMT